MLKSFAKALAISASIVGVTVLFVNVRDIYLNSESGCSEWSTCSATCDGGVQTRNCSSQSDEQTLVREETRTCKTKSCSNGRGSIDPLPQINVVPVADRPDFLPWHPERHAANDLKKVKRR